VGLAFPRAIFAEIYPLRDVKREVVRPTRKIRSIVGSVVRATTEHHDPEGADMDINAQHSQFLTARESTARLVEAVVLGAGLIAVTATAATAVAAAL
jgi:hypothetical protein